MNKFEFCINYFINNKKEVLGLAQVPFSSAGLFNKKEVLGGFSSAGLFNKKEVQGQVSLEYLLILISFFAVLSLIIPIIFFSINQVFVVMDTINAREISLIIEKNDELFLFLSDNSLKKFEFNPVNEINVSILNNEVVVSSSEKEFKVILNDSQEKFEKTFSKKFYLEIKKENNVSKFNFYD